MALRVSHSPGHTIVNLLPIRIFLKRQFHKIISLLKLKTNWIKFLKNKLLMYILTFNFQKQASIIGTWLHWNKSTSINNFIVNVIIQATSIFVNFNLFIKINYSNFIHCCLFFYRPGKKNKLTCCGWASTEQYSSRSKHFT
jgi:hypothetical protein